MPVISRGTAAAKLLLVCTVCALAAAGSVGCQAPGAQLKGFADATVELQTAIRASGDVTVAATGAVPAIDEQNKVIAPSDPKHPANQLAQLWQERTRAMDGLVAYADALASIAAASDQAQQNTEALGESVKRLTTFIPGTASTSVPAGEIVTLAAKIGEIAIQVKAAKDLGDEVSRAPPALEGIAIVLGKDLKDLETQYKVASQSLERATDTEFGPRNEYRKKLIDRRGELRNTVANELTSANLEMSTKALEMVDHLIKETDADDIAYNTRFANVLTERRRVIQMIGAARAGVQTWLTTHQDLARAIEEGRHPNVRLVLAKAQEIRTLVDALRAREHELNAAKK